MKTIISLVIIVVVMTMASCKKGNDNVFSPRGSQQCTPLLAHNGDAFGEYELKKVWSGWDIWIGDAEKNMGLAEGETKCFVTNMSKVPLRISWYPRKRKWIQPGEKFLWYKGLMKELITGQGVDRKHFNVSTDKDIKTLKFSIKLEFKIKAEQLGTEIPVTATYSDNV